MNMEISSPGNYFDHDALETDPQALAPHEVITGLEKVRGYLLSGYGGNPRRKPVRLEVLQRAFENRETEAISLDELTEWFKGRSDARKYAASAVSWLNSQFIELGINLELSAVTFYQFTHIDPTEENIKLTASEIREAMDYLHKGQLMGYGGKVRRVPEIIPRIRTLIESREIQPFSLTELAGFFSHLSEPRKSASSAISNINRDLDEHGFDIRIRRNFYYRFQRKNWAEPD